MVIGSIIFTDRLEGFSVLCSDKYLGGWFFKVFVGFCGVFVLFVLLDVGKIGLFGGICIKILIEQEK